MEWDTGALEIFHYSHYMIHCVRRGLDKILSQPLHQNGLFSLRIVTRCRLYELTNEMLSEAAKTCIFLASIWLAFAGHVVLFWLWLPRRGRWTARVDSEIQRKTREMLGISSLKGYPSGGIRCCMPQQMQYAGVCADWEQKLSVFRSRPNLHRHGQRHCQWASSLVRRLWLARFVSGWKAPPQWRYGANRLAPAQWRCGSNSTTAFGV